MPEGKAPPIGRLRNFAELYDWVDRPQTSGPSAIPTYTLVARLWCSLKARVGDKYLFDAQIDEATGPRGTHTIRCRFRQDLTVRHMLQIAGKKYRIVSINPDDARRFSILEVEAFGDAEIIQRPPRSIWDWGHSHWDNRESTWDEEQ